MFGDTHGNVVHLFERDCSVQRRHQKILEEAPAPGITPAQRERHLRGRGGTPPARSTTSAPARSSSSLDGDGNFYFMEMNTRLQVEHPVTELVTGQDLVEWQLRVAAGEPLPVAQEQIAHHGPCHRGAALRRGSRRGISCRPPGSSRELHFPAESRHLRVDTGVQAGDAVSIHYDPLLAKLIAWDVDRAAALRRLRELLAGTRVAGVKTNLEFLAAVAGHEVFARGGVDTGFVEGRLMPDLQGRKRPDSRTSSLRPSPLFPVPEIRHQSPWEDAGGWRLGRRDGDVSAKSGSDWGLSNKPQSDPDFTDGRLVAPMPGRVVAVSVAKGQAVRRGDPLMVLEAMKMEHTVAAPADGVVSEVWFAAGDLVEEGAELLVLT